MLQSFSKTGVIARHSQGSRIRLVSFDCFLVCCLFFPYLFSWNLCVLFPASKHPLLFCVSQLCTRYTDSGSITELYMYSHGLVHSRVLYISARAEFARAPLLRSPCSSSDHTFRPAVLFGDSTVAMLLSLARQNTAEWDQAAKEYLLCLVTMLRF